MATVTVTNDSGRPWLMRLAAGLSRPRGLMAALGARVEDDLRDHFAGRNTEGNKQGWPRTNFWAEIREATALGEVTDSTATVLVGDYRFGHKVRGGRIVPKAAKALTIPIHRFAYGRRASVMEDETGIKLFRPKGKGDSGPRNVLAGMVDGRLEYFYRLVGSVNQEADPKALPEDDAVVGALLEEAAAWVEEMG